MIPEARLVQHIRRADGEQFFTIEGREGLFVKAENGELPAVFGQSIIYLELDSTATSAARAAFASEWDIQRRINEAVSESRQRDERRTWDRPRYHLEANRS